MRLFTDFPEAQSELKRDLAEMGAPFGEYKEMTDYHYAVMRPDYTEIQGVHEEWAQQEWKDRLLGNMNPGKSWRKNKELWGPRREVDRGMRRGTNPPSRFSYTHSHRMGGMKIQQLILDLKANPDSLDLYLSVWDGIDNRRRDERRVPETLGYWFLNRDDLSMTLLSRVCDLRDWLDEVPLAVMLLWYVAQKADLKVGYFHHWVGLLRANQEELDGTF